MTKPFNNDRPLTYQEKTFLLAMLRKFDKETTEAMEALLKMHQDLGARVAVTVAAVTALQEQFSEVRKRLESDVGKYDA